MRKIWSLALACAACVALASPAFVQERGQDAGKGREQAQGSGQGQSRPAEGQGDRNGPCVECHRQTTPRIVADWEASAHAKVDTNCVSCHGTAHTTAEDWEKAELATPDICAQCHQDQVDQFKRGKHALAWESFRAMPTTHWQPMALMEGLKGCSGCHKIGLKDAKAAKELRSAGQSYGNASCDACHTRHAFSKKEAKDPQACRTCHMGIDHPQWEMYESSKHGVRHHMKQAGVLPETAAAPTCQFCHMQNGDHANITAWGFMAVRLPMPDDKQWAADRATVLKGIGVLDPEGKPTARLDVVKAAKVARLDQQEFDQLRDKMLNACKQCHSENFARSELEKGDQMIREADRLMAMGIETVAGLYRNGMLSKPANYAFAYPDLLAFHDAPTQIEERLFLMFLKHRMRTFQGAFHNNPDYALWYGWSEMVRDATAIREMADQMAINQKVRGGPFKPAEAPAAGARGAAPGGGGPVQSVDEPTKAPSQKSAPAKQPAKAGSGAKGGAQ